MLDTDAARKRYANVFFKEEGANPTGTFKARGLAMAITMLRSYSVKKVAVPFAGNAGGAVAAYAAAAGIEAHIFMPKDVSLANQVECIAYGAHMTLVDGLISDCAQAAGCAPVAKAYDEGANTSEMFKNAATFASGLHVPKPYGDYIILDDVRRSSGAVVALDDDQLLASLHDGASNEGF